jgi:hypothetical protein
MADSYISVTNADALVVPVKSAVVYAAMEKSLFLGGELIPIVNAPNGVLQVPELASVTATSIAGGGITTDVAITNPADTKNTITCDLIAARSVIRDLGNIDPMEIGRMLGMSVAKAFDSTVYTALDSATASTVDSFPMTVDAVFDAVAQIRGAGETGSLVGVVNPTAAKELLKAIGTAAYAGSDNFQAEALRSGALGSLGGVQFFVSSLITTANTSGYIMGTEAARIAMQRNVDVEIGRRTEAVGNDVVASLMAAVGLVDATRAVKLINV